MEHFLDADLVGNPAALNELLLVRVELLAQRADPLVLVYHF